MPGESVYLCTYSQGNERVTGRVRAWDGRDAAQLFATELEAEGSGRRVAPEEVRAVKTRPPGRPQPSRASASRGPRRRASGKPPSVTPNGRP